MVRRTMTRMPTQKSKGNRKHRRHQKNKTCKQLKRMSLLISKPLRLQPTKFSETKIREARIKRELPQEMIAKTILLYSHLIKWNKATVVSRISGDDSAL